MDLNSLVGEAWTQAQGSLNNQFLSGGLVLGAVGAGMAYARRLPARLWSAFLFHFTVVTTMTSSEAGSRNSIFMQWLNEQPYAKKMRRTQMRYYWDANEEGKYIQVPGKGHHFFFWKKRPIWLYIAEETTGGNAQGAAPQRRDVTTIRMLGRRKETIQAVLDEAEALYDSKKIKEHVITVLSSGMGSSWNSRERRPRSLDTVYLPKEAEGIVEEIKDFYNKEQWYIDRGIPFRRGYLLWGPPGTGKTASVEAIAGAIGADIYHLSLASILTDEQLVAVIQNICPSTKRPNIILLEDVDTAIPEREQDKMKSTFSLGTLLNCLDGLSANDRTVLFMTTNKKEALDPALIRPGRIDRIIEFGYATDDQIQQAIEKWFPLEDEWKKEALLASHTWTRPITMAQVQENLRHLSWDLKSEFPEVSVEDGELQRSDLARFVAAQQPASTDGSNSRSVSAAPRGSNVKPKYWTNAEAEAANFKARTQRPEQSLLNNRR